MTVHPPLEAAAWLEGTPLDHNGGIALWRQIARAIEQDVTDGVLPPGARLPTEAEMSAHFGVNRHTVRRALEELSRAGMVQVEQGRGSFIAEDVLEYAISARTRFSEWIRAHNKEPGGRVLDLRELTADAATAVGLGLDAGARVVRLERLGLADGRPARVADQHFSAARQPGRLAAVTVWYSRNAASRPGVRAAEKWWSARLTGLPSARPSRCIRTTGAPAASPSPAAVAASAASSRRSSMCPPGSLLWVRIHSEKRVRALIA